MNLYFDTEFTGLVPGTTLISLGIVSETGDKFYAEFTDYDESLCDDWIKENVLSHLWLLPNDKRTAFQFDKENKIWYHKGDSEQVRDALIIWIDHEFKIAKEKQIQFISDVCHYDFYLLQNQVFGGAFEMPEYINPVCYDICQDINEWSCMGVGNNFSITKNMYNAFDISREELAKDALLELPKGRKHNALYDALLELPKGRKHNALYDAEVIRLLYEYYYSKKFARRKYETIENFKIHKECCRDTFDSWFEDAEYLYETAIKETKKYSEERKE